MPRPGDLMADAEKAASDAADAFEAALVDLTGAKPEDLAAVLKVKLEAAEGPARRAPAQAARADALPARHPDRRHRGARHRDRRRIARRRPRSTRSDDVRDAVTSGRFRFEWSPEIVTEWPAAPGSLITMPENALSILVEGKVGGPAGRPPRRSAELRDFTLHLFPGEPLMRVPFEHIAFVAGSNGQGRGRRRPRRDRVRRRC